MNISLSRMSGLSLSVSYLERGVNVVICAVQPPMYHFEERGWTMYCKCYAISTHLERNHYRFTGFQYRATQLPGTPAFLRPQDGPKIRGKDSNLEGQRHLKTPNGNILIPFEFLLP